MGWVILFGFIAGIPTAIICGPVLGKYISKRIITSGIPILEEMPSRHHNNLPSVGVIISIITIPIVLILLNTTINSPLISEGMIPKSILKWLG